MDKELTIDDLGNIEKETVISSEDKETNEKFIGTIAKAKLLYETVVYSEEYQYGIAQDGEQRYILVYTSSIDGKVHSKRLNGVEVEINNVLWNDALGIGEALKENEINRNGKPLKYLGLKPGYIRIYKQEIKGVFKKTYYSSGIIAHNGRLVCKPRYNMIKDIGKRLVIVSKHLSKPPQQDEISILNYEEGLVAELSGGWYNPDDIITLLLNGEKAWAFVFKQPSGSKNRKKEHWKVLVIYKGRLWQLHDAKSTFIGSIYEENEKLVVSDRMNSITEYTKEEILKKIKPIDIGGMVYL